jgi:hypothetical protein
LEFSISITSWAGEKKGERGRIGERKGWMDERMEGVREEGMEKREKRRKRGTYREGCVCKGSCAGWVERRGNKRASARRGIHQTTNVLQPIALTRDSHAY